MYNNHQKEEESKKIGEPIDTSDILMQLKQMKENLENELKEKGVEVKNTLKLAEDKVNYKINQNFEEQQIEQKENNEKNLIDENQKEEPEKKIEETENLENKEITEEKDTKKEQIVEKQPEEVPKNETEDNTEEIIEQIENPEIKQEFKEIKEKMEQLNDNPQVVSEDFNEMYTKLFGRPPIQDEPENEEPKEKDIDILKDNVSVFEGIEEYKKNGLTQENAIDEAIKVFSRPKTSEHNTGLSVDFNAMGEEFKDTKEYDWLLKNSTNYGFILRYQEDKEYITNRHFEPAHFRYVGEEHAQIMKSKNLCLEEYISTLIE